MYLRGYKQYCSSLTAAGLALILALQGCNTTAGGTQGTADGGASQVGSGTSDSSSESIWKVGGCLLGGAAGLAAAKALAAADAKKKNLSKAQLAQRERGYMITFALLGCGGGSVLGGTIFAKLSEAGRKEREKALVEAASQATPQRYGEPSNPALKGAIKPGKRYAELDSKRECMDVEDTLSDGSSKDAIFVKMCRSVPNGGWAPVTA